MTGFNTTQNNCMFQPGVQIQDAYNSPIASVGPLNTVQNNMGSTVARVQDNNLMGLDGCQIGTLHSNGSIQNNLGHTLGQVNRFEPVIDSPKLDLVPALRRPEDDWNRNSYCTPYMDKHSLRDPDPYDYETPAYKTTKYHLPGYSGTRSNSYDNDYLGVNGYRDDDSCFTPRKSYLIGADINNRYY